MEIFSNFTSTFPTFLLTGIPGLESVHAWVSIPFCCLYAIALSGNSMILFAIITQHSLHEPMYYFLSMLSAADLGLTISTMSTTLAILWFNAREISLDSCITQMFFLHGFTFIESGVLVAMAFDRLVAICNPLRYTAILTNSRIIQMGLFIISRTVILIVPLLLLLKPLSFCKANILSHSYCYHPDVIKLACSDTRANNICGLIDLILTTGVDTPCIVLSYILIIRSVLRMASPKERHKVFSTCVSHVGAVAIFYIPMISLSLVHRYGRSAPKVVHSMMANVYLLLPPVLNPVIYSVKAKQIRKAILSLLLTK
ncbi:olfactory receptor 51F1 [Pipistrellus kuhlii]|uniref:Olfactory receptor family 51 subfamily F member 1 n=1 Tax=Pipistrellus kuhlii TaxID=59472 RepID=A0A7J7X0U9_PIPKU|nr:olfactory receptor 51F1 [Pipistrellus kuhlii]KAF6343315.1 olfactory receptor family 51 subfamily F member 1 [Pipistrellus kuhlii]